MGEREYYIDKYRW